MDVCLSVKKRISLLEKKKKQGPLSSSDKDLKDLLSQCQGSDVNDVRISCSVLQHAVLRKWIIAETLINDLQLIVPAANHPQVIVSLLLDVLRYEHSMMKCVQSSLLVKRHPLVSISSNNSILLHISIHSAIDLLKINPDVHSFNVLKPFFKYLLLDPHYSPLSDVLHEQLLQLVRDESPLSRDILDTIVSIASFYRIDSIDSALSTIGRVSSLSKTVIDIEQTRTFTDELVHFMFSLCVESTSLGLPLLELTLNLTELIQFRRMTPSDCLCLSWLIIKECLDSLVVKHLLDIVQCVLASVSPVFWCLFKLPLILLVSQTTPNNCNKISKANMIKANQLLLQIETEPSQKRDCDSNDAVNHNLIMRSSISSKYLGMCFVVEKSLEFIMGRSSIDRLASSFQIRNMTPDDVLSLGIVICGIESVPTLIHLQIPLSINNMGSLMVAYVVYTLGKVSDRETCFKLLQSLPLFCSNFISTEMVTSTLLTLTKSPDILPTALRLLTKTWEKQDKILPYILRLLLPPVAGKVEWSISSAACLSDICRLRPEVHGEECIPYISQLLSYSKDPLMTALLISALTSLCSNSIVEPGLLWKLLGPQLSSRDSPIIDQALCEFFTLAAETCNEGRPNQKFCQEALQNLWNMTLKEDAETVNNSVKAITNFPLESLTRQVLPDPLLKLLPYKEEEEELDQSVLSSAELLLIFLTLTRSDEKSLCLKPLITYLVEKEIASFPRGTVYNALQKLMSSRTTMDKSRNELEKFLKSCCTVERGPAIYYLNTDVIVEHQQSLPRKRDQLLNMIRKALRTGTFNELCILSEGIEWNKLMTLTIETHIKVSGVRLAENGQKRNDIVNRAISDIVDMLKDSYRDCVFIGMGSVVGLVTSELVLDVYPQSLLLVLQYVTSYLNNNVLYCQHKGSSISDALKVLLTTATVKDITRSILAHVPVLTHFLGQYPLKTVQVLTGMLKSLASEVVSIILRNDDPDITSLACSATSAIVQDLSFIKEVTDVVLVFFQLQKGIKIDASQSPLLVGAMMLLKDRQFDCLGTFNKILELIGSCTVEELKILCTSVAGSLPLLVSTRSVSTEDCMSFIQALADRTHKESELHWVLGTLVHDLYMLGSSSIAGLIEKLALKWIQEGMASDATQLIASLFGLAGLLGLSPLNLKLKGGSNSNFMQTLLLSSLPFLYQCASDTDETVRNTGLWTLTQLYTRTDWEAEKVPEDLDYLPGGSSLPLIYSQLVQYCKNQTEALITKGQAISIVSGLADVIGPLPVANWSSLLIPVFTNGLCQEAVIKLINNQYSNNSVCFKNVLELISQPIIISFLKENSKRDLCLGLSSMAVVLSPSLLFLILVSHISDPITLFCSILSLLVLPSNDLKPFLELVMDMYCHSLEGGLECSSQSEIFQPTDPFLDILNQCLSKSSAKVPPFLKSLLTCSSVCSEHSRSPLLKPLIVDHLFSKLSPLEEKWLLHTVRIICSGANSSYCQLLLLTILQDWIKENDLTDLCKVGMLLIEMFGAQTTQDFQVVKWPIHQLKDTVQQRICETGVVWLLNENDRFQSLIKGLLCSLRHSKHYCRTTPIWTSVAQIL